MHSSLTRPSPSPPLDAPSYSPRPFIPPHAPHFPALRRPRRRPAPPPPAASSGPTACGTRSGWRPSGTPTRSRSSAPSSMRPSLAMARSSRWVRRAGDGEVGTGTGERCYSPFARMRWPLPRPPPFYEFHSCGGNLFRESHILSLLLRPSPSSWPTVSRRPPC